ncbi:MAG: Yip1 family protein [Halobacteriales archaeon]
MSRQYTDLLTDPRSFFEREGEHPSVLLPATVVLLVGTLSALGAWFNFQRRSEFIERVTQEAAAGNAEGIQAFVAAFGVIMVGITFVAAFIGWLYYGAFTFGISALLDGEGDFKTTIAFVGWGFVPKLFEVALKAVGKWYVTGSVELPAEASQSALQAYSQAVSGHPVNVAMVVLGIAALLWSGYIWYHGLQVSRRLDGREALIAVGIPVGLVLLTRLWNLINAVSAAV